MEGGKKDGVASALQCDSLPTLLYLTCLPTGIGTLPYFSVPSVYTKVITRKRCKIHLHLTDIESRIRNTCEFFNLCILRSQI